MKVQGYEIPEHLINRVSTYFPVDRSFTLSDLTGVLERIGVPSRALISYRAADRILQKWRKAGTHVYSGGKWRRVR